MDNIIHEGFITLVTREVDDRTYEVIKSKPAVAAVIANETGEKILLVKQFRPAVMKYTWEIPAGMMDVDGEEPYACIVRELKEETDICIDPVDLVCIAAYHPHIGCSDAYIEIYSASVEQEYDYKNVDDADVTQAKWFTFRQIQDLINDSLIIDGKTMLGICAYQLRQIS